MFTGTQLQLILGLISNSTYFKEFNAILQGKMFRKIPLPLTQVRITDLHFSQGMYIYISYYTYNIYYIYIKDLCYFLVFSLGL